MQESMLRMVSIGRSQEHMHGRQRMDDDRIHAALRHATDTQNVTIGAGCSPLWTTYSGRASATNQPLSSRT